MAIGKWEDGLPNLPGQMIWKRGGFKYLGVFLGDEVAQQKNWEGIVEKIEGRLKNGVGSIQNLFSRKSAGN